MRAMTEIMLRHVAAIHCGPEELVDVGGGEILHAPQLSPVLEVTARPDGVSPLLTPPCSNA